MKEHPKVVLCLVPWIDRGQGPLHEWVLWRALASNWHSRLVVIGDVRYFQPQRMPVETDLCVGGVPFRTPSRSMFQGLISHCLDFSIYTKLLEQCGSPLHVFRCLLTQVIPDVAEILRSVLSEIKSKDGVLCVVSWFNFPSLAVVCSELGIKLIYSEAGLLRSPEYQSTVYFDRLGVNGNTSVAQELSSIDWTGIPDYPRSEVHTLLSGNDNSLSDPAEASLLGVALQVENDSNQLAFSRGWSALDLLTALAARYGKDALLIRLHPGGLLKGYEQFGVYDDSVSVFQFLNRVSSVHTVNSSVAGEALFFGRRVSVYGDSPVRALSEMATDGALPNSVFSWFYLGYLVPSDLFFDINYLEWRLTCPSWADIIERHAVYYRNNPFIPKAAQVVPKESSLSRFPLQIFFRSPQGYSEEDSITWYLEAGRRHQVSVECSSKVVRFDPINCPGVIVVYGICLRGAAGTVIKAIDGNWGLGVLFRHVNVKIIEGEGPLLAYSYTSDPQFEFDFSEEPDFASLMFDFEVRLSPDALLPLIK